MLPLFLGYGIFFNEKYQRNAIHFFNGSDFFDPPEKPTQSPGKWSPTGSRCRLTPALATGHDSPQPGAAPLELIHTHRVWLKAKWTDRFRASGAVWVNLAFSQTGDVRSTPGTLPQATLRHGLRPNPEPARASPPENDASSRRKPTIPARSRVRSPGNQTILPGNQTIPVPGHASFRKNHASFPKMRTGVPEMA